jgi:DNA-binding NarL/FixJ family response regulator
VSDDTTQSGGDQEIVAPPIEVWVVEDNDHLRRTLAELLEEQEGIRCSLATRRAEAAISAVEDGAVPRVVLMDLGLPGMDGLEGIKRLKSLSPTVEIIVLTVQEDDQKIFEALCAGATGYLLKPAAGGELVQAIRTVVDGGSPMTGFIARKVLTTFTRYVRPAGDYGLTDREREILELLTEDLSQREIAQRLFLSRHTVDTHLRNIYGKLQVHSRSGAVAKALREHLI